MSPTVTRPLREPPTTLVAPRTAARLPGSVRIDRPGHPAAGGRRRLAVSRRAGFIGSFPAVLALSILLAALCIVALASIARPGTAGREAASR